MVPQYARYMPNNGGYRDHEYHIDLEGFLQDTANSSLRNDYYSVEGKANVTATERLSEESKTSNSQFFSDKPTISNSILNLDGNNSPQDDDFPAPIGFQNARSGFNLPTAGARASQDPVSNRVQPQKWTGGPKPYHLLTPREPKALECLKGPPPGMPEHMIRPEDRKYCIFKGNKGPKPSISRPRTPQQQLTGTLSTPAAPKRKTKDRTHQLARPSAISKPRFDLSGVRAATKKPTRDTGYLDVSQRDPPGGGNGLLANGMPRLPPFSLSRKAYRELGTYALRHNGRIPFKKGFGLPSHGRLIYFGPGRLGVKLDGHSSPEGDSGASRETNGTQARRSNGTSNLYQQHGVVPAAEASSHGYAQKTTVPMLNNYYSMQTQVDVDGAMQDLGNFAYLNQSEPTTLAPHGPEGHMESQQPILGTTSYGPSMGMSQDLLLQQPVQWQSQYGTPQQYSKQPELSFPGFGNTPSALQQMAWDVQQPRSHGLNDTMNLHEPTAPPSQPSSQHTTPQLLEENIFTFVGEPVYEYPNGPMAGWLVEGQYYPFEAGPTQAVFPTPPPEQRQDQQQQYPEQEVTDLADNNTHNGVVLPPSATAGEGSSSIIIDAPSSTTDTANTTGAASTAGPAVIPATDDAALDFEELTAQFLRDYGGNAGEGEDDELF